VRPGRVVALALLEGPRIAGLPSDAQGFIPVTELGEVRGLDRVYAARDATAYPIKHGGVAAQQADVVAAAIAARAGLTGDPQPLRPVIRGALLTGLGTRYLVATPIGDGASIRPSAMSAHGIRPRRSSLTTPGPTSPVATATRSARDPSRQRAHRPRPDRHCARRGPARRAAGLLGCGELPHRRAIYLLANPLLREPLRAEHLKPRLLGHWGTCGRARWTRGCCCCTCSRRASSPASSPPGSTIARACWA